MRTSSHLGHCNMTLGFIKRFKKYYTLVKSEIWFTLVKIQFLLYATGRARVYTYNRWGMPTAVLSLHLNSWYNKGYVNFTKQEKELIVLK